MSQAQICLLPIAQCQVQDARFGNKLCMFEPLVHIGETPVGLNAQSLNFTEHVRLTFSYLEPAASRVEIGVRIERSQALTWLTDWLGGASVDLIPEELLLSLLQERYSEQGFPFNKILNQQSTLTSCSFEGTYQSTALDMVLGTQTHSGKPLSLVIDQGIDTLLTCWPKRKAPDLRKGSLKLTTLVGAVQLGHWEYRCLDVGDVVFFDQCLIPKGQVVVQLNGLQCWLAAFEESQLTLAQPLETPYLEQETPMATDLEQIPVNLNFEIGSARLNLSEVSQLQPGYVFELSETTTDQPVRVIVGDQEVGRGELVSLNEKLGVRLTHWQGNDLGAGSSE